MPDSAQIPIRASTQEQLPVEEVVDNMVLLKDGSCAIAMSVSAVNFDLLSEREQDAIIGAYGALLNSLTFPIQILVRSKKKDISSYLELLTVQENHKKDSPLIANMIHSYRQFVGEMVKKNNVLDKKFYVVIPFSALELGVTSTLTSLVRKNKDLPFKKDYILQKAKISLVPKREHVTRLFNRIGLVTKQLETKDLIKLCYEIYNGESLSTGLKIEK